MRRVIRIIALSLLLSIAAIVHADSAAPLNYSVGIILPLTGSASSLGEALRNGMILAHENLNPELRQRLHLHYEDDASQSRNAVTALKRLLAAHQPAVIISALSNSSNAIVPLTENQALPLIAIAVDPQISHGRSYTVNFWIRLQDLAQRALVEAQDRAYKQVAVVTTLHEGNLAMRRAFMEASKDRLAVLFDEEIPPDTTDFRAYLTQIGRMSELDAVVNLLHPAQCGLFLRQARQMGLKLPTFSLGNYEDLGAVKDSGGALIGEWYVMADDPGQAFAELYRQRFPEKSLYGAAYGHDALLLVAAALKQEIAVKDLASYLRSVKNFSGAQGIFSASGDNQFLFKAVVKEVTEEGFKRLR